MKKLLFASVLGLACAISARASILGDTFEVDYIYPSSGSLYQANSAVVPGVANFFGEVFVTVGDGTITVENTSFGWTGSSGFNGIRLSDLSQVPNFTSLSLVSVTGNVPPEAPALTFSANTLNLNFDPNGTGSVANGPDSLYTFAFKYGTSSVPDAASTLPLLGSIMTALVCFARKLSK